jgi:hypothetical protein
LTRIGWNGEEELSKDEDVDRIGDDGGSEEEDEEEENESERGGLDAWG